MPRAAALWLVLLGAASITAGRLFGLIELYVIGVALLVAVVCAVLVVRRPAGLLVRRRVVPDRPSAGQSATVEIRIDAIRTSPLCRVRDNLGPGRLAAQIDVSPLKLGASARSAYRLPTERRGLVTLGPATLEVVDPLGLAVRRARVADREQVVVLPRWTPIALPDLASCDGALIDALRRARLRSGQPDEFRGIREYAPGDDPRRVNWKATARRDDPLVNEYEPDSDVVTTVVLDTAADRHHDDSFETAVSVVTSLAMATESDDDSRTRRLRLVIGSELDVEVDDTNRDATTARLAVVETAMSQTGTPTTVTGPRVQPGHLNVAVIVTGRPDARWLAWTRREMGRVDALVVVTCGAQPSALDGGFAIHLPSFDDFATRWHQLVRRRRSDFA